MEPHLLLLILFLLPYAGRVLALSATAHGQVWLDRTSGDLVEKLAEHSPKAADQIQATRERGREEFRDRFRQVRALWVLLGVTRAWWVFILALVVIGYNGLRLILTLQVGMLRDAEERSSITPRLIEYRGMVCPRRSKESLAERASESDVSTFRRWRANAGKAVLPWLVALLSVWEDPRWLRVWPGWRSALVDRRWCRLLNTWMRRAPARLRKRWEQPENRGLTPLQCLGLWRLHCIARVLLSVAIVSVVINTLVWVWSTTVPVPR